MGKNILKIVVLAPQMLLSAWGAFKLVSPLFYLVSLAVFWIVIILGIILI